MSTPEEQMQPYVLVRLKRPEGYEDVHPELLLEDVGIHPVFEPELVQEDSKANGLDLHSAIMNLPCHQSRDSSDAYSKGYAWGHRDARHAAVELVAASTFTLQARITELEEALEAATTIIYHRGWKGFEQEKAKVDAARAALKEPKQ